MVARFYWDSCGARSGCGALCWNELPMRLRAFLAIVVAAACHAQPTWLSTRTVTPRTGHALAYDSSRGRVVLFGGEWSSPGTPSPLLGTPRYLLADTWEWDGWSWNKCNPVHSPPPRGYHCMAYDAAR